MISLQHNRQRYLYLFGAMTLLSVLSSWMIVTNPYYLCFIYGLAAAFLFIFKFHVFFPLFLVVRSSLDIFTGIGIYLGPMKLNVPSALGLFIDIIGLMYLSLLILEDGKIHFDRISKTLLIWTLSLLFWAYWAYYQFGYEGLVGAREWVRLFSFLMIYLLSQQIVKIKGYEYLINYLFLSLPIPLAVGYYQLFSHQGLIVTGFHRVYGTVAHPNFFAHYLILFIAITIWKIKFSKRRLPWIALMIIIMIPLINTFSISGIVMLCFVLTFILLKESDLRLKIFLLCAGVFFILIVLNTQTGQKRLASLQDMPPIMTVIQNEVVTNTFTWRIVNWELLLSKWGDHPILGTGLATHTFINPWYGYGAHNDYIRFLVELGVVGFIIYIWFLVRVWLNLKLLYITCIDKKKKYLALVALAVFSSWILISMVSNFIASTTFLFYFWSLLACVSDTDNYSMNNSDTLSP